MQLCVLSFPHILGVYRASGKSSDFALFLLSIASPFPPCTYLHGPPKIGKKGDTYHMKARGQKWYRLSQGSLSLFSSQHYFHFKYTFSRSLSRHSIEDFTTEYNRFHYVHISRTKD